MDSSFIVLSIGLLSFLAVCYFVYRYSKTHRTGYFPVLLGFGTTIVLGTMAYALKYAKPFSDQTYYSGAELLSGILPFGAGGYVYYFMFFDIFRDIIFIALFALAMHRFLSRRVDSALLFGVSSAAIMLAIQAVVIGVRSFLNPASSLSWGDPYYLLVETASIVTGSLFFASISVLIMHALMRKNRRELAVACACYPALNLVNSLFLSVLYSEGLYLTFGQTTLLAAAFLFNFAAILCVALFSALTLGKKELCGILKF